jgi:hypothetical protein|mmetsp:Transcript_49957/g.83768  ORF Transcript_49957/g.83768 Transcript_49957/m.83768 type:complete len:101 (-) Transcript_49957:1494-1796(-)
MQRLFHTHSTKLEDLKELKTLLDESLGKFKLGPQENQSKTEGRERLVFENVEWRSVDGSCSRPCVWAAPVQQRCRRSSGAILPQSKSGMLRAGMGIQWRS